MSGVILKYVYTKIRDGKDMKPKETLQTKLSKRKYRSPSPVVTYAYNAIASAVLLPKYNPHITVEDPLPKKGPFVIVWNHLSRLDHLYTMKAAFPRSYNMVAGYSEFFRSHLHAVFLLNRIIPKKVYGADIPGVRAISSVLRQGGGVALSPEGMSSIYGINQPVIPGTGRFLQFCGAPVYFLEMRGEYLTSTKHFLEERKGRTEARLRLLYTVEDLKAAPPADIDAKLNETFRHDEFEWTRENHIKWKMHGRSCEHLDEICYRCPRCGADLATEASDDRIVCRECGNGARMNDYYEFEPFDEKCVLPVSPSKWVEEERAAVIDEIRADTDYSFTERVKLGYLPPYKYVKKKRTSEICGEGDFTIDHKGLHYRGTKLGADWSFDLDYKTVFSLVIMTSTARFALYVDGEFYEFYPERRSVGKMLLLTEEMHRLHVNFWRNFPWLDRLYEGKELGIDND